MPACEKLHSRKIVLTLTVAVPYLLSSICNSSSVVCLLMCPIHSVRLHTGTQWETCLCPYGNAHHNNIVLTTRMMFSCIISDQTAKVVHVSSAVHGSRVPCPWEFSWKFISCRLGQSYGLSTGTNEASAQVDDWLVTPNCQTINADNCIYDIIQTIWRLQAHR